MAPVFSKVDLNKLWHDVQNEETLIFATFGKDLFNISKVIGHKKVAQFFFTHSVYTNCRQHEEKYRHSASQLGLMKTCRCRFLWSTLILRSHCWQSLGFT